MDNPRLQHLSKLILKWYEQHQRNLPWRHTKDPYHIWISEVMLQQTQVNTVMPYYERFLKRFPTVHELASAPLEDVLKAWENMGYYARARHLHAASKIIVSQWNGEIPKDWDDLIRLPGIGTYMAGAILSIAFRQPVPAIDGNVRRIISRLFAIQTPMHQPGAQKAVKNMVIALLPLQAPDRFNQALMDLAAGICLPRKPACEQCPLINKCQAYESGIQHLLPLIKKRGPIPHIQMVAGVIRDHQGQILIIQRRHHGLLGGLWKIPGGRREPEEPLEDALHREILEEIGVMIKVEERITSVKHAYTHFRVTLHAFHCIYQSGNPKTLKCADWRWVGLSSINQFAFSRVDRMVIQALPPDFLF